MGEVGREAACTLALGCHISDCMTTLSSDTVKQISHKYFVFMLGKNKEKPHAASNDVSWDVAGDCSPLLPTPHPLPVPSWNKSSSSWVKAAEVEPYLAYGVEAFIWS